MREGFVRKLWLIAYVFIAAILVSCGGGSGSSPAPQSLNATTATQVTPSSVTLSGKITYDRVNHTENSGLDYANIKIIPARGIVVEVLDASNKILASTLSNTEGVYSFTLEPNTDVRIQAKAQILSEAQAKWDFQVTDNTQSNSLYALQGRLASTGASARQSRDLHAPLGWTGESYGETRAAAPFAIIDSIYSAVQTFAAIDPEIDFPALELRWSINNRTALGNKTRGLIGTSSYDIEENAIYLLGEAGRDTDEYDPHVILHEWDG